MKEIKKTITREEITGYEAFDGTVFRSEDECRKYENSALAAAKRAAWHYLVAERSDWEILNDDSTLIIFDVPDATAYDTISHWAELEGAWDRANFTPAYIGKRVAFVDPEYDSLNFNTYFATKEALLANYTRAIEALFADKETPETK